jgi:hypothetical protein
LKHELPFASKWQQVFWSKTVTLYLRRMSCVCIMTSHSSVSMKPVLFYQLHFIYIYSWMQVSFVHCLIVNCIHKYQKKNAKVPKQVSCMQKKRNARLMLMFRLFRFLSWKRPTPKNVICYPALDFFLCQGLSLILWLFCQFDVDQLNFETRADSINDTFLNSISLTFKHKYS